MNTDNKIRILKFSAIAAGLLLVAAFMIAQLANLGTTPSSNEFKILFVGDTSFGENYQAGSKQKGGENILEERGYDYSLQNLNPILMRSDLVIANLETPLTDMKKSPLDGTKDILHWTDIEQAPKYLKKYNIKTVSLGNNHALDYGLKGLKQSLDVLRDNDMEWFGAGINETEAAKPYIKQIVIGKHIFTMAILGGFEFRKTYEQDYHFYANDNIGGVSKLSAKDITTQIRELKGTIPNVFVVVFPHWGQNYVWKSEAQTDLGHQMIDAGADIIIGHGAHMMQEIEEHNEHWIIYSIGNFIFNSKGRYQQFGVAPFSIVAQLSLEGRDGSLLKTMRLYPIFSDNRITNFQPHFLDEEQFENAYRLLLEKSPNGAFLEKEIKRGQDDIGRFMEFSLE